MITSVPKWLVSSGATSAALQELQREVGCLPPSYLNILSLGNGGEVALRISPFTLCLDSAESVLDYWRSGTYTKNGVIVFGGNGGGSLLAFDLHTSGQWPVVCFDPIDPEGSTEVVAPTFEALLELCEET